jgi:hypothetical protein
MSSTNLFEEQMEPLISQYLLNGNTDLEPAIIAEITTFVSSNFFQPDREYLKELKENFKRRLEEEEGNYDSGDEMHGANNNWKGNGVKYNAVCAYYNSSYCASFVKKFPIELRPAIMVVFSCEAFKILSYTDDENYENDKAWFISNLARVISSFI